ncbi:MAG: hypothetical protein C0402_00360 [Thermodesulfovibrio sp.]|nr:hypothetical protein [Thermodesulfovibrio sp.]
MEDLGRCSKGPGENACRKDMKMSLCMAMRLLHACFLCITMFAGSIAGVCFAGDEGTILAVVNGEQITDADYRRFLLKADISRSDAPVNDNLLKKLVEERLILQEAKKRGVIVTDREVEEGIREFIALHKLPAGEFEKTITSRGMTVGEYKKWLKENIMVLARIVSAEVDRGIIIKAKDVEDYYSQNRQLFMKEPEKITVGAIVMLLSENPSPEEITGLKMRSLRVVSDLRRGELFGKMALLHSEDASREREGILGDFKKGELVPGLEVALASLKEGEVSDPVWVKEGVYILKLVKRTAAVFLPLSEVSSTLEARLLNERKEKKYNEWIRSLWERSSISIQ